MKYTALTEDDEIKVMESLHDFVLRVASETGKKSPEEVLVLPNIVNTLLQCFTS